MAHQIIIKAIPLSEQRYSTGSEGTPTYGDWWVDENGDWQIRVTGSDPDGREMDDQAFLYAYHELTEMKLCMARGVTQTTVDRFDMAFAGEGEPGDDPASPYRREHRQAMIAEHVMADWLGLAGYGLVE